MDAGLTSSSVASPFELRNPKASQVAQTDNSGFCKVADCNIAHDIQHGTDIGPAYGTYFFNAPGQIGQT